MTTYLRGWKQISAYLKVSTRTLQRYEARGLPVRRMPGERGAVFAVATELDRWLLQTSVEGAEAAPRSLQG